MFYIFRLICPKVSVKVEDNSGELSQLTFSTAPLPVINPLTLCSGGRPTITTTHTTNNFTSNNNLQFTSAGTRSNTITSTGSLQNSSSAARQQVHTAAAAMSQARQRILPAVRQTINSPLISTQLKGKVSLYYHSNKSILIRNVSTMYTKINKNTPSTFPPKRS